MRKYNSETDYHILYEAAKTDSEPHTTVIRKGLEKAGIAWPIDYAWSQEPDAIAIDKDSLRAWKELGIWPKPQ